LNPHNNCRKTGDAAKAASGAARHVEWIVGRRGLSMRSLPIAEDASMARNIFSSGKWPRE
jgi:hypothetical protein